MPLYFSFRSSLNILFLLLIPSMLISVSTNAQLPDISDTLHYAGNACPPHIKSLRVYQQLNTNSPDDNSMTSYIAYVIEYTVFELGLSAVSPTLSTQATCSLDLPLTVPQGMYPVIELEGEADLTLIENFGARIQSSLKLKRMDGNENRNENGRGIFKEDYQGPLYGQKTIQGKTEFSSLSCGNESRSGIENGSRNQNPALLTVQLSAKLSRQHITDFPRHHLRSGLSMKSSPFFIKLDYLPCR